MAKIKFDITQHILVPKHSKMTEKDTKTLLERYNITREELPRILITDPAIAGLSVKVGDVVRVSRPSPTAGNVEFYRCVVDGQ